MLRVVDQILTFCNLFDRMKLFNYNYIKIVNGLEYFY